METLDLKKLYRHLYLPSAAVVEVVDVPELKFIAMDGSIEPGHTPGESPAFQEAVGALYGMAYTLKFASKRRADNPVNYSVMALEALWWVDEGEFDIRNPGNWRWRAMIMQPEHIDMEMFQQALQELEKKRPGPLLEKLQLLIFTEGLCMQIMHIGPYAQEPATLEKMDQFANQHSYERSGPHHEIYLGDPRHTDPAKLKTVLRQPIRRIA